MLNLFKNKLLIPLFCVVSIIALTGVGWAAVTPVTVTSVSRTSSTESQTSGITKVTYTTTVRYDFDTLAAAGWYGDTNTTTPLVIPATSLSGVKAWSVSAWVGSIPAGGQFNDSIATSTGDTCEIIWEYSMNGSHWYTAHNVRPTEGRMITASTTTDAGTNFIAFGPVDRFDGIGSAIMDSTAALKLVDGYAVWATANYVRGRAYIHGIYNPVGIAAGSKYGNIQYKGIITLLKD